MNVYECNGTNIFMRWKMKCSIQQGENYFTTRTSNSTREVLRGRLRHAKHTLRLLHLSRVEFCT